LLQNCGVDFRAEVPPDDVFRPFSGHGCPAAMLRLDVVEVG
jgi:hypothetical protein